MGIIKVAASETVRDILADQWLEYFYCDSLADNVLVVKGQKRVSRHSSNKSGGENILSNGSGIAVADGQCMIIVEQGKILDFCDEPGLYTFNIGGEPSLFAGGNLGENVIASLKSAFDRFKFGGSPGRDTRIYYFNTKELIGNKYGTPNPVPFRVVDKNIGLDIDIAIRCFGEYSYKITNPILFYTNVCGNVSTSYTRESIDSQLKTELMTALLPAFGKISAMGIRYSALPGYTLELVDALNEVLSSKWRNLRGLEIASLGVSSVKASDEDEKMIKELQKRSVMRDPTMAAATLVGAQADAMKAAASNANGAILGFMGLGITQQNGGMNAQSLFAMGQQPQQYTPNQQVKVPAVPAPAGWSCSCGHSRNKSKFCEECGKPKLVVIPQYKCDKCGWEPDDKTHPPKFCPECGDPFNDRDIR